MKFLVQGDDFGFTRGVTLGIVDAIDNGILRNTGLFTNMPSAEFAVSFMKDRPQVCFGIDFNIVSGKPVSNPTLIPHLVDENGEFIRSGVRVSNEKFKTEEGRRELFPKEEVEIELYNQYRKFIELTGKKPGYLHAHSIMSEPYLETIRKISKEEGIPFSMDIMKQLDVSQPPFAPSKKVFDPGAQLEKNTTKMLLESSKLFLEHEISAYICHPGYIDAELLSLTTLSLERCKDAEAYMSSEVKKWVEENNVELITYYDLIEISNNK